MRGILAALVLIAGCDALWGLDKLDFAADAGAGKPDGDSQAHTGPFMHFAMDALTGQGTLDSVQGVRAACGATCPLEVSGHIAGALSFDVTGTIPDQRLAIVAGPQFHLVGQFSIAGWIRIDGLAQEACTWSKPYSTGGSNTWQLCINTGGAVSFITYGLGGANSVATEAGWAAPDATFHHVATVYDGTMKTMYWDGEVAAQGKAGMPLVDDDDVLIGNDLDSNTWVAPFEGALDDIGFYTYALTPAEVAVLAAQ